MTIDRSTFDGNSVDPTSGLAGGLYLEYATITLTATTISNNTAYFGGGIWIGHDAVARLTNDTIAGNTATMGGGVWFAGGVTGTFLNVTVADNAGDGPRRRAERHPLQHARRRQHPRLDGGRDRLRPPAVWREQQHRDPADPNPAAACTPSGVVVDPELGALADNGGPTLTMLPASGSPAIGKGTGCPATDQRGQPRAAACTLGAVEAK